MVHMPILCRDTIGSLFPFQGEPMMEQRFFDSTCFRWKSKQMHTYWSCSSLKRMSSVQGIRLRWLLVFMIQAVDQCIGGTEVGIQHEFRNTVVVCVITHSYSRFETSTLSNWVVSIHTQNHKWCLLGIGLLVILLFIVCMPTGHKLKNTIQH